MVAFHCKALQQISLLMNVYIFICFVIYGHMLYTSVVSTHLQYKFIIPISENLVLVTHKANTCAFILSRSE